PRRSSTATSTVSSRPASAGARNRRWPPRRPEPPTAAGRPAPLRVRYLLLPLRSRARRLSGSALCFFLSGPRVPTPVRRLHSRLRSEHRGDLPNSATIPRRTDHTRDVGQALDKLLSEHDQSPGVATNP